VKHRQPASKAYFGIYEYYNWKVPGKKAYLWHY